ncbi:hypothetical protein ILUMI_00811 [Ignelater luminosus]|uniref:Uncharacterized protein n=1 Tax=Ignelater luminosus TaxID=2038154 RepID=A0A8K0DL77_IGNLU|nr:hypothetical protein ILUMI_00811 [Ignelater luminosus]
MTLPASQSQTSEDHNSELITVHAENVDEVRMKSMMVKDSPLSAVIFLFKMSHPCTVRYNSSHPVANFPQLKLAIMECEAVEELKSSVLTDWFGNRCVDFEQCSQESIRSSSAQNIKDISLTECRSPEAASVKSNKSSTSDAMLKSKKKKKLKQKGKSSGDSDTSDENQNQAHLSEIHNRKPQLPNESIAIFKLGGSSHAQNNKIIAERRKLKKTELSEDSDIFSGEEIFIQNNQNVAVLNKEESCDNEIPLNEKTVESTDIERYFEDLNEIVSNNSSLDSKSPPQQAEACSSTDVFILGEPAINLNAKDNAEMNTCLADLPDSALEKLLKDIRESGLLNNTIYESEGTSKTSLSESFTNDTCKDTIEIAESENKNTTEQNQGGSCDIVESSQLDKISKKQTFHQSIVKLIKQKKSKQSQSSNTETSKIEEKVTQQKISTTGKEQENIKDANANVRKNKKAKPDSIQQKEKYESCELNDDQLQCQSEYSEIVSKKKKTNPLDASINQSLIIEQDLETNYADMQDSSFEMDYIDNNQSEDPEVLGIKERIKPLPHNQYGSCDNKGLISEINTSPLSLKTKLTGAHNKETSKSIQNELLSYIENNIAYTIKERENKPTETLDKDITGLKKTIEDESLLQVQVTSISKTSNNEKHVSSTTNESGDDQSISHSEYSEIICKKKKSKPLDDSDDQILIIKENFPAGTNDHQLLLQVDSDMQNNLNLNYGCETTGKDDNSIVQDKKSTRKTLSLKDSHKVLKTDNTINESVNNSKSKSLEDTSKLIQGKNEVKNILAKNRNKKNKKAKNIIKNKPINTISDTSYLKKYTHNSKQGCGKSLNITDLMEIPTNKSTESCVEKIIEDKPPIKQSRKNRRSSRLLKRTSELSDDQLTHNSEYSETVHKKRKTRSLDNNDNQLVITKQSSLIKTNENQLLQPEIALQDYLNDGFENICEDNCQSSHQNECPEISSRIKEIVKHNDKEISVNVQKTVSKLTSNNKNEKEENINDSLKKQNKVQNNLTGNHNKNNKKTRTIQNKSVIDIEGVMTDTTNIIKYKVPQEYIKCDCKHINKRTKESDKPLNVVKILENKSAESCSKDQTSNKSSNKKRKSSEQFDVRDKENPKKKSIIDNNEKPKRTIKRRRSKSEIRKLYKLNDSSYFEYTEQNDSEQLIITVGENSDTSDLEISKSVKAANNSRKEITQRVAQEEIKNNLIYTDIFNSNQSENQNAQEDHLEDIFLKEVQKEKRKSVEAAAKCIKDQPQLNEKSYRTEKQHKFHLLIQSIDKSLNAYSQRMKMIHKHSNSKGNKYKSLPKDNHKSRFKAKRKSIQYTNCQTENDKSITSVTVLEDDDIGELNKMEERLSNIIRMQKEMGMTCCTRYYPK